MYPLTVVLAVGWLLKDRNVIVYSLPLSAFGLLIAVYHNLLYYHVLPESIAPCTAGVSCTSRQIEWGGFVTIPLLSLLAFTLISALLVRGAYFKKQMGAA